MDVDVVDKDLRRLEIDPSFSANLSSVLVKIFRKRMRFIRSAQDERDFYQMKSLHFEKLAPPRDQQHSMRLNDQYRLIVELEETSPTKIVRVIEITDYH